MNAAKGKIFNKDRKRTCSSSKEGGGPDPANNSRLRDVIAKAKANNMPNDNIDRSIKKAAGEGSADNYEHITYEGYGPNGTAIIVKALTDNKNRTASNVRNAFTKGSGNVGTPGCVSFMFDEKGQIIIAKEDCDMDSDELMMLALDAGAEDFVEEEDSYEVLTVPEDFSEVRLKLEEAGMVQSMSRVAHCTDNGVMEGFWGILKREMYYGKKFESREELEKAITEYIDYYTNDRPQRGLGVLTPMEFHEKQRLAA